MPSNYHFATKRHPSIHSQFITVNQQSSTTQLRYIASNPKKPISRNILKINLPTIIQNNSKQHSAKTQRDKDGCKLNHQPRESLCDRIDFACKKYQSQETLIKVDKIKEVMEESSCPNWLGQFHNFHATFHPKYEDSLLQKSVQTDCSAHGSLSYFIKIQKVIQQTQNACIIARYFNLASSPSYETDFLRERNSFKKEISANKNLIKDLCRVANKCLQMKLEYKANRFKIGQMSVHRGIEQLRMQGQNIVSKLNKVANLGIRNEIHQSIQKIRLERPGQRNIYLELQQRVEEAVAKRIIVLEKSKELFIFE